MRNWFVLAGVGCLVLAGCAGSDDEARPDDRPTAPPAATAATLAEATEATEAIEVRQRPHLACLPLDQNGWSRSEQIVGVVGYPASLAASDDAVVILGETSPAGDVAAFRSIDGHEWQRAEGFPDPREWGPGLHLAGGSEGFVAVGTRNGSVPNTPVVAVSADGATWEQLAAASLPREQVSSLSGVFAGPSGFVVVGNAPPGGQLFVWHSADGRTWSEADVPPLRYGAASVAAIDAGWIAVTADENGQVRVWTSADGERWVETDVRTPPPDHAVRAYVGAAPLVVHGGALVLMVSGAADDDPWPHTPTVWVSTDEGTTWNERLVLSDTEANGFQVDGAASTGFGIVLAGQQGRRSEHAANFLHHSGDGISWEPCWTTPLAITQIVAFGDGLVAYDAEFGDVFTWTP